MLRWKQCVFCGNGTARVMMFQSCKNCLSVGVDMAPYGAAIFALMLAALGIFDLTAMLLDYMVK